LFIPTEIDSIAMYRSSSMVKIIVPICIARVRTYIELYTISLLREKKTNNQYINLCKFSHGS